MNPQLLNQTRLLVQKYDDSLKINAALNAENQSLQEELKQHEENSSILINHYQDQLCDQTARLEELKDIIRIRDIAEQEETHKREAHDRSISDRLNYAKAKEVTHVERIHTLEEEIERLHCMQRHESKENEQKFIAERLKMKESFEKEFECLRQKLVSNMYGEVGDVLANSIQVNDKLSAQLKSVLAELESLQLSQEEKEKELSFAKREIKLLKYKEKMKVQRRAWKAKERASSLPEPSQEQDVEACDAMKHDVELSEDFS